MRKAENQIATMCFDKEDDILYVDIRTAAIMDLETLKLHFNMIRELTQGQKYMALINAEKIYTIEADALEFASSREATENRVAAAYYNPPLLNRLNIFTLQRKLNAEIPTAVFPEKNMALEWLMSKKGLLKQN